VVKQPLVSYQFSVIGCQLSGWLPQVLIAES